MTRIAAILALLFGCDSVFGLDEVPPPIDAAAGAEIDAAIDARLCVERQFEATLLEDTSMLPASCGGATRLGTGTNINIGQGGTSRVLLRFSLPQTISDALADNVAVSGVLAIRLRPNDCACTNAATNFQVFAATDGWNEGNGAIYNGADWCNRIGIDALTQTAWQVNGADGSSDRSQLPLATRSVTTAEVATPGVIAIPFTLDDPLRTELRARIINNRLSLLLAPTGGGTLFLYSREGLPPATTGSTLTIRECR